MDLGKGETRLSRWKNKPEEQLARSSHLGRYLSNVGGGGEKERRGHWKKASILDSHHQKDPVNMTAWGMDIEK